MHNTSKKAELSLIIIITKLTPVSSNKLTFQRVLSATLKDTIKQHYTKNDTRHIYDMLHAAAILRQNNQMRLFFKLQRTEYSMDIIKLNSFA